MRDVIIQNCSSLIPDIMAAFLSTLATNIDSWQSAWLPFLTLAVGCCLLSNAALNLHVNQKSSGVKQMLSSRFPQVEREMEDLCFRGERSIFH